MAPRPPGAGDRDVRPVVDALRHVPGVRGSLLVATDGLVIAARVPGGMATDALAALAATLGRELEVGGPPLRRGQLHLAQLTAADGLVLLAGTPIGFLVVVAEPDVDREAVRQAVRRAGEDIRRAWSPRISA
jgi:predicted regulator of Ras-like GTPase activity (Roadblock/LC7/MglB family)